MGLGSLLELTRPKVPKGCRAFVSTGRNGTGWCVRVAKEGEDQTPACHQLSPPFGVTYDQQDSAEKDLVWINGGPAWQTPGAA